MKNLALHILDIVQNSISAKATIIEIDITESEIKNKYLIVIKDNGIGISADKIEKVLDPYETSRTTRKVGLGLPLFKQSAERAGGGLKITSELGKGTIVEATFELNNFDRPPIGDIAGILVILFGANPTLSFAFRYKTDKQEYAIDTKEIKEVLDDISIADPKIRNYLKEMINENLKEIKITN